MPGAATNRGAIARPADPPAALPALLGAGSVEPRAGAVEPALAHLRELGYRSDADDDLRKMRENPTGQAGFPQIYILDPDRNVIEINAAALD